MKPKKGKSSDDDASCPPLNAHQQPDAIAKQGPTSGRSYKSKRTVLTRNACIRCRTAKTKCTGKHPSCARCIAGAVQCVYEVTSEGITKMQDLQQKLERRTEDLGRAMTVINAMQQGSDQDATELLARLRLGDPLEKVVDGLQARSPSATTSHSSMSLSSLQQSPIMPPTSTGRYARLADYSSPALDGTHCALSRRDSGWPTVTSPDQGQMSSHQATLTPSPLDGEGFQPSFPQYSSIKPAWPGTSGTAYQPNSRQVFGPRVPDERIAALRATSCTAANSRGR